MKLSIIIVNYNVRFFIEQALISVRKAVKNLNAEIFVVDNNSIDGSVEMIRNKFPEVILIANKVNGGFAVANNQALRMATGEFVLLLNPDTVVEEDTFDKCLAFMKEHEDAGGLGVKMLDGQGKYLPESKRGFPSPAVAFYKAFGLSKIFPRSKTFGRYHLGHLDENKTNEVDVLAGAFMLIRKKVLDKTGLLDENFFMYGEDIDLSFRILKSGYKNYYFAGTRIIHYKGESTKKGSLNYVKMFYQAMILFARKHFSSGKAGWLIFFIQVAVYFRALLSIVNRIFQKIALQFLDASVIYGSIYFIKKYWEQNVKAAEGLTYPKEYLMYVVPSYILIWVSSVYLSGGYDKPFRPGKLVRGLIAGTVIIAALYGFMPESLRFSRAIILLGAAAAVFMLLLLRIFIQFFKTGKLNLSAADIKKLIIVGSKSEGKRVHEIVKSANVKVDFIGFVNNENDFDDEEHWLGKTDELPQLVQIYKADEIIFCGLNISSQKIIDLMTIIGTAVDFKIVAEESLSIIGSNSKNMPGELYTIDVQMNIATQEGKRTKRVADIFYCFLLLPLFPFIIWFTGNPVYTFVNWIQVLLGLKTWIGYSPKTENSKLPHLKKSILNPTDEWPENNFDQATTHRLNLLYAKNYSAAIDFKILINGWRKIGTTY